MRALATFAPTTIASANCKLHCALCHHRGMVWGSTHGGPKWAEALEARGPSISVGDGGERSTSRKTARSPSLFPMHRLYCSNTRANSVEAARFTARACMMSTGLCSKDTGEVEDLDLLWTSSTKVISAASSPKLEQIPLRQLEAVHHYQSCYSEHATKRARCTNGESAQWRGRSSGCRDGRGRLGVDTGITPTSATAAQSW